MRWAVTVTALWLCALPSALAQTEEPDRLKAADQVLPSLDGISLANVEALFRG